MKKILTIPKLNISPTSYQRMNPNKTKTFILDYDNEKVNIEDLRNILINIQISENHTNQEKE